MHWSVMLLSREKCSGLREIHIAHLLALQTLCSFRHRWQLCSPSFSVVSSWFLSRQRLKLERLDLTAYALADDFTCLSPDDTADNVLMAYPADLLFFHADLVAFKHV